MNFGNLVLSFRLNSNVHAGDAVATIEGWIFERISDYNVHLCVLLGSFKIPNKQSDHKVFSVQSKVQNVTYENAATQGVTKKLLFLLQSQTPSELNHS